MKNFVLTTIAILTLSSHAQAKVTTTIDGEEALTFALASQELSNHLVDIDGGNLVAVKLVETGTKGDISNYRHVVNFDYFRAPKHICKITISVGLKTVTHGRPLITVSEKYIDSSAADIKCRRSR